MGMGGHGMGTQRILRIPHTGNEGLGGFGMITLVLQSELRNLQMYMCLLNPVSDLNERL